MLNIYKQVLLNEINKNHCRDILFNHSYSLTIKIKEV